MPVTRFMPRLKSISNPRVIFPPASQRSLIRGIDLLVEAIRPSLGPTGQMVAVARSSGAPEFLDDGATVARRIIQISDPDADMGAMLLRHALWKVHDAVGDGTVTTAVMLQAAVHEGYRMLAAGIKGRDLQQGIQWAFDRASEALRRQARPLDGRGAITRFALAMCGDPEIAELVGEILDTVGTDAYVQVQEALRRGVDREYVEGSYWAGTCLSRYMTDDVLAGEASVKNAAVVVSDLAIEDAEDAAMLLETARRRGAQELLVVAREISASAASVLATNQRVGTMKTLVVDLAPSAISASASEDIAILTGAVPLLEAAGNRFSRLTTDHLGQVRRAWATNQNVGLTGGAGDPRALRQHIAGLRQRLNATDLAEEREFLRVRVGRLMGGTATLLVGGNDEFEMKRRADLARRAVTAARLAVADGVVPGGGSGLLHAARTLGDAPTGLEAGAAVMLRALEAPLRAIADNAGYEPSVVVARVRNAPEWNGWDALSGDVVDMWQAGILDPVGQLATALQMVASVIQPLLTSDVLVHRKRPEMAGTP